ncbi:PHD-finger domain-containing protein [Babesia ovis]|uniref:PHD-finger domain-containing protein n=1 Tax=Babesia ovis TaxID=5869 RepID=A0A9W5WTY8_BABOV|nr:PHD-finger domain-containing protein [Babesia ovis]
MADPASGESTSHSAVPTDYISALEHYGSLSISSDLSRSESQVRSAFGNNAVIGDSWSLGHSNYDGFLFRGFDPLSCDIDLYVAKRCGIYHPDERVLLPPDGRCDACLGPSDSHMFKCTNCGVMVHDLCYLSRTRHKVGVSITRCHSTTGQPSGSINDGPPASYILDGFLCDICSSGDKPLCILCGLGDGAMRYCTKQKVWVHCSCVIFAPKASGIQFASKIGMDSPEGLDVTVFDSPEGLNSTTKTKPKCDGCGSTKGLVVPCSFVRCSRHIHTRCALFYEDYDGTAFSDHVYYTSEERGFTYRSGDPQYIGFIGAFCKEHSSLKYVTLGIQMYLRKCHVIREGNSSSYRRYQTEVANIMRMTSAVTASALVKTAKPGTKLLKLDLKVDPCIQVESEPTLDNSNVRTPSDLDDWKNYFCQPLTGDSTGFKITPLQKLTSEDIDVNLPIDSVARSHVVPVVEMTPHGDADSSTQYRGQRMIWQKLDIFRPIPYGPAADLLLSNQDQVSRKKSLEECPNLENTVLACSDFLDPRDLSDMYLQQILHSCNGIITYMHLLKTNIDRELQPLPKSGSTSTTSGNTITGDHKSYTRFHVLVDTGRTAGIVIFRINKRLLDAVSDDTIMSKRSDKPGVSVANIALDEEIRQFLSQLQNAANRSSANSHSFFFPGPGGTKEMDILSGFNEYGLKDDVRELHAAISASSVDGEVTRIRKKVVKKAKAEPSLKDMELENFVALTPIECELLRRSVFEMSYVNEANLKLAVVKDTVDATPRTSCLQMLDWNAVKDKIKANIRSIAGSSTKSGTKSSGSSSGGSNTTTGGTKASPQSKGTKSTTQVMKNTPPVTNTGVTQVVKGASQVASGGATQVADNPSSTANAVVMLPPVPMVYLGRQTWPIVDDVNFVKGQQEITERDLAVVSSQLRTIRENIRENVLELNARIPTMNERLGYSTSLLQQYESMERWSTLLDNFCRGLCDSTDNKTPTTSTVTNPPPPVMDVSRGSDARAAAMKAEGIAEGAYCSVCFINTGTNLNPIYTCCRCYMSAHRNCYGINKNAKIIYNNNEYVCRRCEYERRSMGSQWQVAFRSCSVICAICGRGGGALKRCDGEDWAHMFCLLSLMPETVCSNYVMMEPWTLTNISKWRNNATCLICGVSWGYVMGCIDCDVKAHPLCAWLHGFKFSSTSSLGYESYVFKGNSLMRELSVRIQCNDHDSERQWQQFVSVRNKRFINRDTAARLFEGRDKRRKCRSVVMEGMTSLESLDLEQLRNDIAKPITCPTDQRCGVCFGSGNLSVCTQCEKLVHYSCYVENDFDPSQAKPVDMPTSPTSFICDVCRHNDEGAFCAICQISTGLLKKLPSSRGSKDKQRRYIHTVCGVCFPDAILKVYKGKPIGQSDVNTGKCIACRRTYGLMVQCFHEGCELKFHPNCGMENRFIVESHCVDISAGPQHVAFCYKHALVSRSIGNNLKLLLRLRTYLKLMRELVGDLASQDTVMRAWYRKRQELLNVECPLGSLIKKNANV